MLANTVKTGQVKCLRACLGNSGISRVRILANPLWPMCGSQNLSLGMTDVQYPVSGSFSKTMLFLELYHPLEFQRKLQVSNVGIQMVPFITPHHFTPLPPVCSLCGTPTLAALWGALAPLPAVQKWGPGLGRSVLSQGIVMSASPSIRLSEVLSPPRQRISAAPQSLPSRPCSCGFSSVELQRSFRGDCQPGATF